MPDAPDAADQADPADEAKRVAVYYVDEDERAHAEAALGDSATPFANVIEGSLHPHGVAELVDAGLVVEELSPPGPPPSPHWDLSQAEAVAELQEQARYADLPVEDETATLAGDEVAEDVYRIELRGPITQEQRLALDGLGIDIAAFEPPSYYRTFLTGVQHAAVRAFDWVADVVPYRFEDKLAPSLVAVVEEQSEAQGDNATMLFDCLLHRERDMPHIREMIDDSEAARVVGHSNLRIRFAAQPDLPLLGALATRPEVRKLSVFHPPTSLSDGEPTS